MLLLACASESASHPAHRATTVEADGRVVPVDLWYPTAVEAEARSTVTLVRDADDAARFEALLDEAPTGCPSRSVDAAEAAPPAGGPHPLVLMSHCHGCTAFSTVSVAEQLAAEGWVVVAPEHVGDTLWDRLDDELAGLDDATLALRTADLRAALDAALAGGLGIEIDGRVGLFGHSFGAVTVGVVAEERGLPAMFVGAPPENPLFDGADVAGLTAPALYALLEEDHSIGAAGNLLLEGNFAETPRAWLARVADAGHWSPSDLVGLSEELMPGCGEDVRQADDRPFSYLDPAEGRRLAGVLARDFFAATLLDDPEAEARLADPGEAALTVEAH